jgi:hypothetical protein
MTASRSDRWAICAAAIAILGALATFAGTVELTAGSSYRPPPWTRPAFTLGLALLVVAALCGVAAIRSAHGSKHRSDGDGVHAPSDDSHRLR